MVLTMLSHEFWKTHRQSLRKFGFDLVEFIQGYGLANHPFKLVIFLAESLNGFLYPAAIPSS
jgi:hypothetical protein